MRLLQLDDSRAIAFTKYFPEKTIPAYAILSHTWGDAHDEVSFSNVTTGEHEHKRGFSKIQFCGKQAEKDGLRYFWVDSCCIDKSNLTEYTEAITSMFQWYKRAVKCYVHLADVSHWDDFDGGQEQWETHFQKSRWFTRGWTLQELIAPASVEFFSKDGKFLGDRKSLELLIHQVTTVPLDALRGAPNSEFDIKERFRWAEKRQTTREVDMIYCLQGLLDVYLIPNYGEPKENARARLLTEIELRAKRNRDCFLEEGERPSKRLRSDMIASDKEIQRKLTPAQQTEILEALHFDTIDDRHAHIQPELAQTCTWILEHDHYKQWLEVSEQKSHCGVLWIKGRPGCGKSTMMKFLLARLRESLPNTRFLSYFFNARGDLLEKNTLGLYRSLLLQLLNNSIDTDRLWETESSNFKSLLSQIRRSTEKLKALLRKAIRLLGQSDTMILVDALDECEDEEIRDMISFFEKLSGDAGKENKRLRILFSSRLYPYFSITRSLNLEMDRQKGHALDIKQFLLQECKAGNSGERQALQNEIQDRASGVFLWVVLVVQILNKHHDDGHDHSLRKVLNQIPSDLSKLFRHMLLRDRDHSEEMKLCLQWVLFANRSLEAEELYHAVLSGTQLGDNTQQYPSADNREILDRFILSSSKGLVEVSKARYPRVQFIHESIRDYLLKQGGLKHVLQATARQNPSEGHDLLKQCCQNYLQSSKMMTELGGFDIGKKSSHEITRLRENALSSLPLLHYSFHNVFQHANSAQAQGLDQTPFLQCFQLNRWVQLNHLFVTDNVRGDSTAVDLLYILADEGTAHLITIVAETLPITRLQQGRYGNPVFAAIAQGHGDALEALIAKEDKLGLSSNFERPDSAVGRNLLEVLLRVKSSTLIDKWLSAYPVNPAIMNSTRLLVAAAENGIVSLVQMAIDCGVEMDDPSGNYGNALHAASSHGHKIVVQMLLDAGAEVNTERDNHCDALQAAAEEGHVEIVQLLLDAGAEVNTQRGYHGCALLAACHNGHKEIVRILLDTADINLRGGCHGTALNAALRSHSEEIVRMLLDAGAEVNSDSIEYGNALYNATRWCNASVQMILDAGANVNARGGEYNTALQSASDLGNVSIVQLLLDAGADVNARGGQMDSALQAASAEGHIQVVQLLLDSGADVNASGGWHCTALRAAILKGYTQVVSVLLESGAEVDVKCSHNCDVVLDARRLGRKDILNMLLDARYSAVTIESNEWPSDESNCATFGDDCSEREWT